MIRVGHTVKIKGFSGAVTEGKVIRVDAKNPADIIFHVQTGRNTAEKVTRDEIELVQVEKPVAAPVEAESVNLNALLDGDTPKKRGRPKKEEAVEVEPDGGTPK
jgi:hypothetical protein